MSTKTESTVCTNGECTFLSCDSSDKTCVKRKWKEGENPVAYPSNYTKDCGIENTISQSSKVSEYVKSSNTSSISNSTSCSNGTCTSLSCNNTKKIMY